MTTSQMSDISALHYKELQDLLELVNCDGSISDLDVVHESEFGTPGEVLLSLMRQHQMMRESLTKITKIERSHYCFGIAEKALKGLK